MSAVNLTFAHSAANIVSDAAAELSIQNEKSRSIATLGQVVLEDLERGQPPDLVRAEVLVKLIVAIAGECEESADSVREGLEASWFDLVSKAKAAAVAP
jgi:ribosome maturation protein Sdo1